MYCILLLTNCCFDFVQIREELRANGIDVYPQKEFDEDAEDRMINEKIRVSLHYTIKKKTYFIKSRVTLFGSYLLPLGDDPFRSSRKWPGVPGQWEKTLGKENKMGNHWRYCDSFGLSLEKHERRWLADYADSKRSKSTSRELINCRRTAVSQTSERLILCKWGATHKNIMSESCWLLDSWNAFIMSVCRDVTHWWWW